MKATIQLEASAPATSSLHYYLVLHLVLPVLIVFSVLPVLVSSLALHFDMDQNQAPEDVWITFSFRTSCRAAKLVTGGGV